MQIDTSAILHFDLFGNAANIEKLIGSAAFCVNDVLDAAGMPKINEPWANQHFVTKTLKLWTVRCTALMEGVNKHEG